MASNENKGFPNSYMFLKPEDARFRDLLHVLYSRNLGNRKFVDSHEGSMEESFRQRWLIFVSLMVQKILLFVKTPLSFFGTCVEMLVNMVALNGGFFMMLINLLTGHLVIPDRESPKYLSCIGNLDRRVKLNIVNREDSKYHVSLAMMASKASYENAAYLKYTITHEWKMEFVGFYDCWNEYQRRANTEVLVFLDKDTYVVAFRGTEPFDADDWCTDLDISWYGIPGVGKMHGGFMKALGLQKNVGWPKEIQRDERLPPFAYYVIRDILKKRLSENDKAKFILTGHSLGGALAILFSTILFLHDETLLIERLQGIYTFGQPRVGDEEYARYMKQKLKENSIMYCRFVYCNDIVPRLPYDDKDLLFKHFGVCLFFNRRYELRVLEEEPNKNYFSPWCVIPMTLNSILELMRSFTIAYINGPHYREGWLLFGFRLVGLVLPGLPSHGPQEYINSTLLGTIESHFKVD
ncbi:triacylglycerol lipase OBL1-like [Gastrolobium bilobum]|uniref:triacylglycerol lipase OBL1-like n=1 Tax=Gastrolobium bilobum TaxID=150636 RepID=UPI002AAFC547|nr:triacylglycerol lipase OBL1-like [Gastrolobium bilobum]